MRIDYLLRRCLAVWFCVVGGMQYVARPAGGFS